MARLDLKKAPALLFIGMPSSGKTTVGGLTAGLLGLPFVDFDSVIENRCGMTVGEIFAQRGQPYFRRLERDIAIELSNLGGIVISPGGGIVESPVSMEFLRMRTVVCRLRRDTALIDTRGRPLLQKPGAVQELWHRREPLYQKYADFSIDNDNTPMDCARRVAAAYMEALL